MRHLTLDVSILEVEHYLQLSNSGPLSLLNKIVNASESTLNPSATLPVFKYVKAITGELLADRNRGRTFSCEM